MKLSISNALCLTALLGLALATAPAARAHSDAPPVVAADGDSGGCGGSSGDGGKAEPVGTGA